MASNGEESSSRKSKRRTTYSCEADSQGESGSPDAVETRDAIIMKSTLQCITLAANISARTGTFQENLHYIIIFMYMYILSHIPPRIFHPTRDILSHTVYFIPPGILYPYLGYIPPGILYPYLGYFIPPGIFYPYLGYFIPPGIFYATLDILSHPVKYKCNLKNYSVVAYSSMCSLSGQSLVNLFIMFGGGGVVVAAVELYLGTLKLIWSEFLHFFLIFILGSLRTLILEHLLTSS